METDKTYLQRAYASVSYTYRKRQELSRQRGLTMYEIHDCHWLPQCGCDIIRCEEWYEVEEYFEDADAMERLEQGYAIVKEV